MRPTRVAAPAYVVSVAVLATTGFTAGSTALILLAYALTLPAGAVALAGYYVGYGLLALLPGTTEPSGDPTAWFATATTLVGVLAPVTGAVVDLAVLRLVLRRRRSRPVDDDSRPVLPAC